MNFPIGAKVRLGKKVCEKLQGAVGTVLPPHTYRWCGCHRAADPTVPVLLDDPALGLLPGVDVDPSYCVFPDNVTLVYDPTDPT